MLTIEILSNSKYQHNVKDRNTSYLKVSALRQPSKYKVIQSINSTLTIEILSNSRYQRNVNHRNTSYIKVSGLRSP